MKRALLLAAATLAAAVSAAPAHAACTTSVRFGGATYVGAAVAAAGGPALRGGVRPGCNDVVVHDAQGRDVSPRDPDTPIALNRIPGVPARLAVAYDGRVYLAEGYLPELAGHPLHRALARAFATPSSCGTAWHLSATVAVTPTPGPVPVRTAGGRTAFLQLAADTQMRGLDLHGFPHLAIGQRIRALVRSCGSPLGGRVLLAQRVTRA